MLSTQLHGVPDIKVQLTDESDGGVGEMGWDSRGMLEVGPTAPVDGQEAGVRWEEARRSLLGIGPEQRHEGRPFTESKRIAGGTGVGTLMGSQISVSRAQGRAWIYILDLFFFLAMLCGLRDLSSLTRD